MTTTMNQTTEETPVDTDQPAVELEVVEPELVADPEAPAAEVEVVETPKGKRNRKGGKKAAQLEPTEPTVVRKQQMINRRCTIAVFDPDKPCGEKIILVDTYLSPELSAASHMLADYRIPQRVSYSDKFTGVIMLDTFPQNTP